MDKNAKIYVAGHRGLVGQALCRRLESLGYENLITASRSEVDLCEQAATRDFFREHEPDYVFLAAARVGGIHANNTYPAQFIYENLAIAMNVVAAAHASKVQKLLFLGSSCIYPKFAEQPIVESSLLTGSLEPTNEPYAVAKIAGLKLCESYHREYGCNFMSVMPTNLYGPGDNFDLQSSHVLPALMRKCHEAKLAGRSSMEVWGSGTPRREFLHVDDLADACVFVMQNKNAQDLNGAVNVGTGSDVTIRELAQMIQGVVGFQGELQFDTSKPDGTPRKQLNVERMRHLGWQAKIPLQMGIEQTYAWFLENRDTIRG